MYANDCIGGGALAVLAVRLDRGVLWVRNAWDANWVEPQNNIITDFEEIFFGSMNSCVAIIVLDVRVGEGGG